MAPLFGSINQRKQMEESVPSTAKSPIPLRIASAARAAPGLIRDAPIPNGTWPRGRRQNLSGLIHTRLDLAQDGPVRVAPRNQCGVEAAQAYLELRRLAGRCQ